MQDIVNNIFSVTPETFTPLALQIFKYQYLNNKVYHGWVKALHVDANEVRSIHQIPYLPISFFKSQQVISGLFRPEVVFESSGTTGQVNSRHFIKDVGIYIKSFIEGFTRVYGKIEDYCIIGLLPSYLERQGSSLVMMVEHLIKLCGHKQGGFYLYDFNRLQVVLEELELQNQKTILIGVTYALLNFAEQYPMQLKNTIVMETGGMKGRKREMIRDEVHNILRAKFGVGAVHSEYGMTELLSQAYSTGGGKFMAVPWMKVLVREEDDPLNVRSEGRGLINVIDLANIHSCSFIATDDAGTVYNDGSFEVAGRLDNSDIRGCSLLVI